MLDRDNISGAVRFHNAAKEKGIKAHIGAEITLKGGATLPLIAETRDGYRNLCRSDFGDETASGEREGSCHNR